MAKSQEDGITILPGLKEYKVEQWKEYSGKEDVSLII